MNRSKKKEEINKLRKQQDIFELKIQKQKASRAVIFAVMCCLLLVVFLIVFLYWKKHDFNQKLKTEVEHKTQYLKRLNNDLAHKNEALHQFNYIVSHDLKEPIRSIVSFSNLIKRNLYKEDVDAVEEYLDFVIRGGKQLHQLVEDIQEYQSIDQKKFVEETTDFSTVIEEVKTSLSAVIEEKGGMIKYSTLPKIPVSRSGLFIIVKNLIENSIKYNNNPKPTVEISSQLHSDKYQFLFKDNGIGIQEDYFEEIFGIFKRLHSRGTYEGTGMGLAISQKVAQKIGGNLKVLHSKVGEGSTFLLTLPKEVI